MNIEHNNKETLKCIYNSYTLINRVFKNVEMFIKLYKGTEKIELVTELSYPLSIIFKASLKMFKHFYLK